MNFIRATLLEDLHDLTTSPSSTNIFLDIVVQIQGIKGPIWTSKVAVYLLFPYLKNVLASADSIILPSMSSIQELQTLIDYLKFEFRNYSRNIKKASLSEKEDQIHDHLDDSQDHKEEIQPSCKLFACSDCPKTFLRNSDLKKHLVKHSNKSHECPICGIRIKHMKNFRRHVNLHKEKITLYHCKICGKDFNVKKNYQRHYEKVHKFIVY